MNPIEMVNLPKATARLKKTALLPNVVGIDQRYDAIDGPILAPLRSEQPRKWRARRLLILSTSAIAVFALAFLWVGSTEVSKTRATDGPPNLGSWVVPESCKAIMNSSKKHVTTPGADQLQDACARIEEFAGAAGARRRLTGTPLAYSCLPHFRIHLRTGVDSAVSPVTFPYHSEVDLEATGDRNATIAMIIMHGAMRDADSYFCSFFKMEQSQLYRDPSNVLVITPDFNYANDEGVQASDAWWNSSKPAGDWRGGADASPGCCGGEQPVSSFDVLDSFVKTLSDRDRFPSLDEIVFVGHSAGGQCVQRYALSTKLPPTSKGGATADSPEVRYIIANPSSYAYLNKSRVEYNCGKCECNRNECTCDEDCNTANWSTKPFELPPQHTSNKSLTMDNANGFTCGDPQYNNWPYGFESRQPYPANKSVSAMVTSYAKRRVVYLVGEKDMCNDLLPTCNVECWQKENGCDRNSMDTRCPAMLQGPFRKLRGQAYFRFLEDFYGKPTHDFAVISGVGHNATAMFGSKVGLRAIFKKGDALGDGSAF